MIERTTHAESHRRIAHLERVVFALALRIGDPKADALDDLRRCLAGAERAGSTSSADVYRDALRAIEDAEAEHGLAALTLTPHEPAEPAEVAA